MLSTAAIALLLSLVVGYSMRQGDDSGHSWAREFLLLVLGIQALVLSVGGLIACGLSIHRERQLNTFDFQRVTRLTPLELALGKLFGAPAVAYFIALCLMPAALTAAILAHFRPSILIGTYVIILLCSVAFQAVGLLLSLVSIERGSIGSPGGLMLFVVGLGLAGASQTFSSLGPISPFAALEFADAGTWDMHAGTAKGMAGFITVSPWTDLFFGWPVHHFAVLVIFYLTITAWAILAVARNLKRDPAVFELYSPAQSVGLLCTINVFLMGFVSFGQGGNAQGPPQEWAESQFNFFLAVNLLLLFALGLSLLRNREQSRRRVRELGRAGISWLEAFWPGPYLAGAGILVFLAIVARVEWISGAAGGLDLKMTVLRTSIILAGTIRDMQYLQWMNLRRSRQPLLLGILYLIVFYPSAGLLLAALDVFKTLSSAAWVAIPIPLIAFGLDRDEFSSAPAMWLIVLFAQFVLTGFFAMLQRRKLEEMSPAGEGLAAAAAD